MKAIILSVGDELLAGDIVDTNASWMSKSLFDHAIRVVERVTIPDDIEVIAASIRKACRDADLVAVCGGLGPTGDDLTRNGLAHALGEGLIIDETVAAVLKRHYAKRGREVSEQNLIQAMRPISARCIPNPLGSAPGLRAEIDGATVILMPGVPREMKRMWDDHVSPLLSAGREAAGQAVHVVNLRVASLPESTIGKRLSDLMERGRNPSVGTYPGDTQVAVRVRGTGTAEGVKESVEAVANDIEARLAPYIYGRGDATLPTTVMNLLVEQNETVATAESCTAGLLGALLTEPPGSSRVYVGGVQTYSNEMKTELLGVDSKTLTSHGAVSEPTAREMAVNVIRRTGASCGLAITGIAGPGGATQGKPVGTVFIGLARRVSDDEGASPRVLVRRFVFPGDRRMVRVRTAQTAMAMLYFDLSRGGDVPPLICEAGDPEVASE